MKIGAFRNVLVVDLQKYPLIYALYATIIVKNVYKRQLYAQNVRLTPSSVKKSVFTNVQMVSSATQKPGNVSLVTKAV